MKTSARKQRLFQLFERAAERSWRRRLRELMDAIGEVHAIDRQGRTMLMIAADYGQVEMVQLLLEAGADANAIDNEGMTPLMHAAEARGRPHPGPPPTAVVRLLLAAGADPTLRCKRGWTAEEIALYFEFHMGAVAPERRALARMLRNASKSFRACRREAQRPRTQ
jgi:hypothetical protein